MARTAFAAGLAALLAPAAQAQCLDRAALAATLASGTGLMPVHDLPPARRDKEG